MVPKVVGSNPIFHPSSRRKVKNLAFFCCICFPSASSQKLHNKKINAFGVLLVCVRGKLCWVARMKLYYFFKGILASASPFKSHLPPIEQARRCREIDTFCFYYITANLFAGGWDEDKMVAQQLLAS